MEIGEKLRGLIAAALRELCVPECAFSLEHPEVAEYGDYASNAALVAGKALARPSREAAEELAAKLRERLDEDIERVEVAGPGFINFFLSTTFFASSIERVLAEGERFGSNETFAGKRVMVEYTDPNPFKVFHIGHLMTNVIGESLARLAEFSGAEVKRANYQGDVGLHVAKALWGMMQTRDEMPNEGASLTERTDYLGRSYARGAAAYDEKEDAKRDIHELNKYVYAIHGHPMSVDGGTSDVRGHGTDVQTLYETGRRWSLEHFEELYRKLGTKFDFYFFESEVAGPGKKLVEAHTARGIFEESDGAVVFRGEKQGLHTRVFLTKEGLPTYEAKELALAREKYEKYPYDLSLIITANEITDYFRVLLAAMREIFPDLAAKTRHVAHGMLRFASGKMSSRSGNVVTGESLIEDSMTLAREKIQRGRDIPEEEFETIAEAVGIGALKYAILRQQRSRDIMYDAEKSFSLEGDSGPYVQYAYVRARSVLEKARSSGLVPEIQNTKYKIQNTRIDRLLYQFPEVVSLALAEYEPHHITTYLTELAASFNSFYAGNTIIDPDNPDVSAQRLALTAALAQILKNGLNLLGISAPCRM